MAEFGKGQPSVARAAAGSKRGKPDGRPKFASPASGHGCNKLDSAAVPAAAFGFAAHNPRSQNGAPDGPFRVGGAG